MQGNHHANTTTVQEKSSCTECPMASEIALLPAEAGQSHRKAELWSQVQSCQF